MVRCEFIEDLFGYFIRLVFHDFVEDFSFLLLQFVKLDFVSLDFAMVPPRQNSLQENESER